VGLNLFIPTRSFDTKIYKLYRSCGPKFNARWEWDLKHFSLVLTAVRPINEGEEITIPYVAPNKSNKERQDILSNFYGFKCSCPFCTLPDVNIRLYDLARSTLASTRTEAKFESFSIPTSVSSILPSFEKWCLDPTFPDDILINAHIRALQRIEREELEISSARRDDDDNLARDISKHLDAITMCYGALEDMDNFQMWMERVREMRLRNNKPEQELVLNKWLSNPELFPVWGWRRVFCGEFEGDVGLAACVSMGMF
jgi:hypothetical protein